MPFISIEAHVDVDDVVDRASDKELRDAGIVRFDPDTWRVVAGSIRRRDFDKAIEELTDIARRTGGVDLPPFVISAVS